MSAWTACPIAKYVKITLLVKPVMMAISTKATVARHVKITASSAQTKPFALNAKKAFTKKTQPKIITYATIVKAPTIFSKKAKKPNPFLFKKKYFFFFLFF